MSLGQPIAFNDLKNTFNASPEKLDVLKNALKSHSFILKEQELKNLSELIRELVSHGFNDSETSFYFGIKPPAPINDEFDMFFNNEKKILNFDFKDNTIGIKPEEEIKISVLEKFQRQERLLCTMQKGRYLCHVAMYVSEYGIKYWKYSKTEKNLEEISINEVCKIFQSLGTTALNNEILNINPSDFIISPVTNTDKFLNHEYWLTEDQNNVVKKVMNANLISNAFSIEGAGGSGKTMVAFDIILKLPRARKLYSFTGRKRQGHFDLEKKIPNLTIVGAKEFAQLSLEDFDVILIDEAQRSFDNVRPQLDKAIRLASNNEVQKTVVFYDVKQSLSKKDFGGGVKSLLAGRANELSLTDNVRSNENINAFVNKFLDLSYSYKKGVTHQTIANDVMFRYFTNKNDANQWLSTCSENGYSVLEQVPEWQKEKERSTSLVTTDVIGEDVSKVAIMIDERYEYKWIEPEPGTRGSGKYKLHHINEVQNHYHPIEGLYVNLSRAKEKIAIAVVNNPDVVEVFANCIFGNRDS
ncbi:DUF2075 domain-containing protein [Weissella ceti]|uniref:DUF2075 domain-containing protein n=1 Tax=Weissella ceti TaxID=759620 RepID=A0ABT3E3G0_9LACO|nr:DNA/RNA helicase domain-containing protein [Weissella ceti]MCW0952483.1 DUF2075 domain-containing protein [Weissella ceti]QVK11847.1 DUF2075 domain-containing protein [Weissella ceti]